MNGTATPAAETTARRHDLLIRAVSYMADAIPSLIDSHSRSHGPEASAPILYGPNGSPIRPDSYYSIRRSAAKREGSMKNWIPQRLFSRQMEAIERERIVERSIDLAQSDPNAAGVADTIATTVIGSGLTPLPIPDSTLLHLDPDPAQNDAEIQRIRTEQKAVYQDWYTTADASCRMSFGALTYLIERMLVVIGEYLVLLPMLDDPTRPYSLACQIIHPLRLKTPSDLINDPRIKDGVELGEYGEPVAYWIKKSSITSGFSMLADVSTNFLRVLARTGHRWNALHGFVATEPEQVRGLPRSTPALKFFRDLNDYLDAELVSNIVTAAFSLFIAVQKPKDPYQIAQSLGTFYEDRTKEDGTNDRTRYQELIPGSIMYGNENEEPHPIAAARPGATFDPFTKIIKKAIAMAHGIPYPVLFNDVEGVNYAGFRSAMLSAWRVFMFHRTTRGQMLCQPIYTMLMEEAYLRGTLNVPNFYSLMRPLTRCDWRGSAKGDIEPVKAAQANIMLRGAHLKTDEAIITELDGDADITAVYDQLKRERDMRTERGLTDSQPAAPAAQASASSSNDSDQDEGDAL